MVLGLSVKRNATGALRFTLTQYVYWFGTGVVLMAVAIRTSDPFIRQLK